jgi:uncharacterized protein YlxP (DUF503 family)
MEVKSPARKLRNKFNISAAETAEQDILIRSSCSVLPPSRKRNPSGQHDRSHIAYLENNTEAEITDVLRELR